MKRKLANLRILSQAAFLLLFVYILWSTTYPLTGRFAPDTFFKFNPLITILTSLSERIVLDGIIQGMLMLALTIILGRFFCGWICPLGTCIDLAGRFRKEKGFLNEPKIKRLAGIKYYILAVIIAAAALGVQILWPLEPITVMARFVSLNFIPVFTYSVDRVFVFLLNLLNRPEMLFDFYRSLKASFLGVEIAYFPHTAVIFLFFMVILGSAYLMKRSWCRVVCPLGALYAVFARIARLKRSTQGCVLCAKCKAKCPTAAINDDMTYSKSECILCLDCIDNCPIGINRFGFSNAGNKNKTGGEAASLKNAKGISRRDFLFYITAGLGAGLIGKQITAGQSSYYRDIIIRPPASLKEDEFLNRCVRCGNCMKVCITNGLQPIMFEAGIAGIWTPQLVPEIGYCEYKCTLCGQVCPTGAIKKINIAQKLKTRLGIGVIDRNICLPWVKKRECIVCEEFCPVKKKAIKLKKEKIDGQLVLRPYVDAELCIGCGVCQTKCPVRPVRAIKMLPIKADRV
ncbi:MAG: 4Fe-4S binding protein [Candidatus Omnitrophota bacterium]